MPTIRIKADLKSFQKKLSDVQKRQIPFAIAGMLNGVAKRVQEAETKEVAKVFEKPTPFTERAFAVKSARKSDLVARVFAKDIQAAYLAPYIEGGDRRQVLGSKRAILMPMSIALNQYGNIPKGKLARLKGRADIFIGPIKTKNGVINGVWQRPPVAKTSRRRRGAMTNPRSGLKLLIRFEDPKTVNKSLPFFQTAQEIARKNAPSEFAAAWSRALSTARK